MASDPASSPIVPAGGPIAPATVLDGRYRLDAEIDATTGAFGAVYRGRDLKLERDVAIKVLRQSIVDDAESRTFIARFKLEALGAANLEHPNIIEIYDYNEPRANDDAGSVAGLFYYVMRHVTHARSVAVFTKSLKGEPFPIDLLVAYARQATEALRVAHAQGIVHRDVKASNMLVFVGSDGSPQLKLIDFGVAHLPRTDLTATGELVGTPSHWSPEYLADGQCGPQQDLWALGVMLYRCLTKKKPFSGENQAAMMAAIKNSTPVAPRELRPDVPVGLEHVVLRLLEKDPAHRYPDAVTLAHDLERYQELPEYRSRSAASDEPAAAIVQAEDPLPAPPDLGSISSISGSPVRSSEEASSSEAPKDEKSSGHEPRPKPEAEAEPKPEPLVPAEGDAAKYVSAFNDTPRERLHKLPKATQVAVGIVACVAAALLAAFFLTPRQPQATSSGALAVAEAARPDEKPIAPGDILRDRDEAKRRNLVVDSGRRQEPTAHGRPADQSEATHLAAARSASVRETGRRADRSHAARGKGTSARATHVNEAQDTESDAAETKDLSQVIRFTPVVAATATTPTTNTRGPLGIPPHERVAAQLAQPIALSGATPPVPVSALLPNPLVYPGRGVVLPANTRAVGTARIKEREGRVHITFSELVFPDRSHRSVSAIATMPADGSVGLVPVLHVNDARASANLKEGLLDMAARRLGALDDTDVTRRFESDARRDIRDGHEVSTTMSLAAGFEFALLFTRAL